MPLASHAGIGEMRDRRPRQPLCRMSKEMEYSSPGWLWKILEGQPSTKGMFFQECEIFHMSGIGLSSVGLS